MGNELSDSKYRILVVEDNPADVALLRLALQDANVPFVLTVVEDGADALEHIRKLAAAPGNSPDLVILDLNLPKHDGLEILADLRAMPALSELPVLILTSSSSPRERARLEALQIKGHLTKPLDFEAFMRVGVVIRNVLFGEKGVGAAR